jgi:hypothetical protein
VERIDSGLSFNVLAQNLPGGNEENHEKPQLG